MRSVVRLPFYYFLYNRDYDCCFLKHGGWAAPSSPPDHPPAGPLARPLARARASPPRTSPWCARQRGSGACSGLSTPPLATPAPTPAPAAASTASTGGQVDRARSGPQAPGTTATTHTHKLHSARAHTLTHAHARTRAQGLPARVAGRRPPVHDPAVGRRDGELVGSVLQYEYTYKNMCVCVCTRCPFVVLEEADFLNALVRTRVPAQLTRAF